MAPELRRTDHSRALPTALGSGAAAGDPGPSAAAREPRLAAADRVRFAAFEAGLLGVAAASVYALTLVLLRASGAAAIFAAGCCALLLLALAALARDPLVAFVTVRGHAATAIGSGALAGVMLAAIGADNRLLFLPALLLLATLGTTTGPRTTLAASALATGGLLAPLLTDPAAVGERRMLALTAAGLLAIPPLLATLLAQASLPPTPTAVPADPRAEAADSVLVTAMSAGLVSSSNTKPALIATAPPAAGVPAPPDPSPLTPRQLEAVALTAIGLRHGEIAERLGVSVHQVRRLLRQGRERVHASTTRELVAWAMMRGIIGPETETRPSDD